MNLVDPIAQAIATMEGFFKAGSLAARNNNPGNLRSWGANPIVNGYAQFKSAEEGWAALKTQVQKNINRGLNLNEFFAGKPGVYYAGGASGGTVERPIKSLTIPAATEKAQFRPC